MLQRSALALTYLLAALSVFGQSAGVKFLEHTVATGLAGGYQVVIVDMNHDGKPDLVALASGRQELVWYENPGWQRHVITGGLRAPINVTVVNTDAGGIPVLALAHEFSQNARRSIGIVSLLESEDDPRQPWKRTDFDRLPASHRLRMVNGLLVNAPLTNANAEPPDYRG